MSRKARRGNERPAEPSKSTRGIGKAILAERKSWMAATFGTVATAIGTAAGTASGLASSGVLGAGTTAVGTGILAATTVAAVNVAARDRSAESADTAQTTDTGGGSGGAGATVQDVIAAVGGVVNDMRSDIVNSTTGIKTRIEVALSRILAVVPVSSHDAPERIKQALQNAMREVDQVHRTGVGAIDKAEQWGRGL